jgi:uncharacterized protein YdcH (DUF465 family)
MINILGIGSKTSSILKAANAVTAQFTKMRDKAQKVNDKISKEQGVLADKIVEIEGLRAQLGDAAKINTNVIAQVDKIIGA